MGSPSISPSLPPFASTYLCVICCASSFLSVYLSISGSICISFYLPGRMRSHLIYASMATWEFLLIRGSFLGVPMSGFLFFRFKLGAPYSTCPLIHRSVHLLIYLRCFFVFTFRKPGGPGIQVFQSCPNKLNNKELHTKSRCSGIQVFQSCPE